MRAIQTFRAIVWNDAEHQQLPRSWPHLVGHGEWEYQVGGLTGS